MATRSTRPVRLFQTLVTFLALTLAGTALANDNYTELPTGWCYSNAQPRILLKNGQALLAWQGDGNLVLYNRTQCANPADGTGCGGDAAIWSTGTAGRGKRACFYPDGNFSVLTEYGQFLFSSGTEGWAFKTHTGHFLRAVNGGGSGLRADAGHNQAHERFDLIDHPDGSYALRTHTNRHYVAAEDHGEANANRTSVGGWEKVFIEQNTDGTVSIRSAHWASDTDGDGNNDTFRYLRAENGGGANARFDVTHSAAHERFTMLAVDKLVLEGCTIKLKNAEQTLWSAGNCALTPPVQHHYKEDSFGDSLFGAGYYFGAGFQQPYSGYARAFAGGDVWARVFGQQLSIVQAGAQAVSLDNVHSHDASMSVLGINIPITLPTDETDLFTPLSRSFFSASSTFMAGPVPLFVSGEVTGTLGMTGQIGLGGSGGSVTITPYLDVSATAQAGIGGSILGCTIGAGIQGTLSLVNVSAPFTVAVDFLLQQVSLVGDLVVTNLSGSISLFAQLCIFDVTFELADWPAAFENSWSLVNKVFTWGGAEVGPAVVVTQTIRNYWRSNDYLNTAGGALTSSAVGANAALSFTVEPVTGTSFVHLRASNGLLLHAESGAPAVSPIHDGAHSAMWTLEDAPFGTKRIRNRWTGHYLHTELGGLNYGPSPSGNWSSYWVFE